MSGTAGTAGSGDAPGRTMILRGLAALWRFRWLLLSLTIVGTAAGIFVAKRLESTYTVHSTIWVADDSPRSQNVGPIRAEELLTGSSWQELLRSYAILDNVSRRQQLYLQPDEVHRLPAFTRFDLAAQFRPGRYRLSIAGDRRWTLSDEHGATLESGAPGDSIGRRMGFLWHPTSKELDPGTTDFLVMTPREASVRLNERLVINRPAESNLMRLSLTGDDPDQTSATMNALIHEFVNAATSLKRHNLVEVRRTLEQQLDFAARELRGAEIALENFRVNTITLPSEGGPVAGGVELTRDPVLTNFFRQKIEYDNARYERETFERLLADVRTGQTDVVTLAAHPAVQQDVGELRTVLAELSTREHALRAARKTFTDDHKVVRDLQEAIGRLRTTDVPMQADLVLRRLARRERELASRIEHQSEGIKGIPSRTIEEQRLRRNVEVRATLYTTLRNRFTEASLAEGSAMPDLSILDSAVAPRHANATQGPLVVFFGAFGSLAVAMLLALGVDRLDRRFRYPEQASGELGLDILGAVPPIPSHRRTIDPVEQSHIIEAFRSIRLNTVFALAPARPLMLTVTSPGAGDGKSLLTSNLALSFAEAGYRTLLIDGDIRRGILHRTFGISHQPGLLEVLSQECSVHDALHPTQHAGLTLLPSGRPRNRGPEMLLPPSIHHVFAEVVNQFDVILVDSPPLGAGVDPLALAVATGNLLMVLRAGETDRRLAEVKLRQVDRLPVRVVGAVLNEVSPTGTYRYYGYLDQYALVGDSPADALPQVGTLGHRS